MSQSEAGKGDIQCPIQNQQEWDQSYERTFGMLRFDWPKCSKCKQPFIFEENEPFAHCDCGTTEWGNAGRPDNWMERQRHHFNRPVFITERDLGDENDHEA